MSRLRALYAKLPRAGRWLAWAVAATVAYFLVVEPVLDATSRLAARANQRESLLRDFQRRQSSGDQDLSVIERGERQFGRVEPPGEEGQRRSTFNRRVREIVEAAGVKEHSGTSRTTPLAAGPLVEVAPEGRRIDRVIQDIQFDATPEQVAAVLSGLERCPEVAAVSRVQIRPGGGTAAQRLVRANLSVECLVITRAGGAASAGAAP